MIKAIWNFLFYEPFYNGLAYLVDILPNHSLLIAVVVLTIFVRLIISPLSFKSIKTNLKNKKIQPELQEIKKIKDKQEQAQKTMELYKKHGINPFSSFFLLLIQLPIILGLYWVFRDGTVSFNPDILYSFVPLPNIVNTTSFGIDLAQKSVVIALLVGVTQYIHMSLSTSFQNSQVNTENQSDIEKTMASVGKSMKYTLPIFIGFISYSFGSALAIYWLTSNVFMIFQELYIQKKLRNSKEV